LKVEKLQVTNFRNLEDQIISFSAGINCILGENGNGKTNILEALYVLATKKSFRKNAGFPQYLGMDGEKQEILFNSVFRSEEDKQISLSGKMNEDASSFYMNGKPIKRINNIKMVFINPFDSYSFHNTPGFRRTWFNQYISMLSCNYKKTLTKYNTALRFRNNLLSKRPPHYRDQVNAIDREIAKHSVIIINERLRFLDDIHSYCGDIFKEIFSEKHDLKISLESKFLNLNENEIFDALQEGLARDILIGRTTCGVHKDDYILLFDGLNSYDYCSLGQQKMSFLSLLFAYIKLFRYKFNSYPIVLIDDVSGELDKYRWRNLVSYLEKSNFQVLITTANEKFKEELDRLEDATRIFISSGSITQ
jgi:DNA replication and repair protein RecF